MSPFTLIDWLIIGVLLLSALISFQRGFSREAPSLVALLLAVMVAWVFGAEVSALLIDYINVPSVRSVIAFGGLFFATLIIVGLISHLLVRVITMAGLSGTDKLLGVLFGFARGALIVVVIVLGLAWMKLTEESWWVDSILIPYFVALGDWIYAFGAENLGGLLDQAQSVRMRSP